MKATCTVCKKTYEAQRRTSKYCGSTCRTRASRAGSSRPHSEPQSPARVTLLPTKPTEPEPDSTEQGPLARRVRAELEAAGWSPSMANAAGTIGAMALDLARTQDDMPPGQNKASHNRELRLTLQDFRATIEPAKGDAVDEAADEQPRGSAGAPDPIAAGGGVVRPFGSGRPQAR